MQMSRRINHTGRKKIRHSEVEILLQEQGSGPPSFEVDFRMNRKELPPDADLYVEAYHRNTLQRFGFGTVGAPLPPLDTMLDQVDLSGPVLFRVKVVDSSQQISRLIALADRLAPRYEETEEQRSSLMIIRRMPEMGNLVWKLSFNELHKPVLCINSSVPDGIGQLQHNPFFQSLVLPSAFREVLMYILWNQEGEQDEGSWQEQWITFANRLAPEECPADPDPDIRHQWIDDSVRAFSEKHHFCEHLIRRMEDHNCG
ncbi:hypothetical protein [Thiolapillus sp.]|uniref:hypothetical protein n=1 Tax=Thiolapillus sp. TaxID=2017437 RepID=UPI0025E8D963|nr:hypothetical protein [Thiolapillus sp.]